MSVDNGLWSGYKGELDSIVKDRLDASIAHEEGDRVPIWDYIDNRATFDHFAQEGDTYAETMVRVYHGLGIDLCRGYGASFEETDDGKSSDDGDWKISGQTQWVTHYTINSVEELAAYEPEEITDEGIEKWLENIHGGMVDFAPRSMFVPGSGCGFHETYGLMGQEQFSLAIYDARDDIERIMWTFNARGVALAKKAAEERLAPLFFTWADIAYKDALLFSPNFLRETFIPTLRNVCEPLNNVGIKPIFHSDGDVSENLDDMIDAGIGGLNPIEPMAGMDIGAVKKRYGDELILVGNVDCSQVLPLGSVDDVIEATKQCLRDAAVGGGHFIGSSSEITPSTPLPNVLAFFETCQTAGRYPIEC